MRFSVNICNKVNVIAITITATTTPTKSIARKKKNADVSSFGCYIHNNSNYKTLFTLMYIKCGICYNQLSLSPPLSTWLLRTIYSRSIIIVVAVFRVFVWWLLWLFLVLEIVFVCFGACLRVDEEFLCYWECLFVGRW